jgi:hypothetical protein
MASQDDILLSLIQSIAGETFVANQQGWDRGTSVCNWHGIGCNNAAQVTRIDLTGYSLHGTLPPLLGQLASLRDLTLANCGLKGSIPTAIARMSSLEEVDLSLNELTGTLPLFESSQLTLQSFAHNQLTGTIPSIGATSLPLLITIDYKVRKKRVLCVLDAHLTYD